MRRTFAAVLVGGVMLVGAVATPGRHAVSAKGQATGPRSGAPLQAPPPALSYTLATSWTVGAGTPSDLAALCPQGMAFDASGHLVLQSGDTGYAGSVCGGGPPEVVVLDSSTGETLDQYPIDPGGRNQPAYAFALDPIAQQIYFARGANRDQIYRRPLGPGRPELAWEALGPPRRQPGDLAVRAMAVSQAAQVLAYMPLGIGRYGPGTQRYQPWAVAGGVAPGPGDLAISADDDVLVVDQSHTGGVHKFSPGGQERADWHLDAGSVVVGPVAGYPGGPAYALAGDGVTESMRVVAFDVDGTMLRTLPVAPDVVASPRPLLAVAPDGGYALFATSSQEVQALYFHGPDGALRATRTTGTTRAGGAVWPPSRGQYGAIDGAAGGGVVVAGPYPGNVAWYGADGVLGNTWETPARTVGLAHAANGDVFLRRGAGADGPSRMERRGPSGEVVWSRPYSAPVVGGIAADARFVYAAGGAEGTVDVLTADTGQPVARVGEVPRTMLGPDDVDVTTEGRMVVLDAAIGRVEVWDLASGALGAFARFEVATTGAATAVAAHGDLLAVGRDRTVDVWDMSGRQLWSMAPAALTPANLLVADVAYDAFGRLYVLAARDPWQGTLGVRAVFAFDPWPADGEVPTVPTPTPEPTPPSAAGADCTVTGTKTAQPGTLLLGDAVTITLTVQGTCPAPPLAPADIELVVDRSGSMQGAPAAALGQAVQAFIDGLDLARHRVGVVAFANTAEVVLHLTNDPRELAQLPASFGGRGGTDIAAGLLLGGAQLATAGRPDVKHVLVLMSDGNSAEQPAVDAATALRGAGVEIYTVGFGSAAVGLLVRVAGDPSRYYFAPRPEDLIDIYKQIASRISGAGRDVLLEDLVAPDMAVEPASVSQPPWSPPGEVLRWRLDGLTTEPVTITYRVRPTRPGYQATNRSATFDFYDTDGTRRRFTYPVPHVLVLAPRVVPTPSPARAIFLPALEMKHCLPATQHADVVLIIDGSSSMTGDKLAAAVAAAKEFVGLLHLPDDGAAVVAYSDTARIVAPFGSTESELVAALDAIVVHPGTKIDLALQEGEAALAGPGRQRQNVPVAILLTDGRHNGPPSEVLAVAARMRAAGVVLFTVALGEDADFATLAAAAGAPDRALVAPAPGDLAGVYRSVAGRLVCR